MNLSRLKAEVKKARTERTELKRVNTALANAGHTSKPETSQSKSGDGLLVRMYLWRSTPYGHLCLVSGPSFDGELHELIEAKGVPTSGIYFPAKNGKPALTKAPRKANPRTQVGKVRTDKKTGKKYVLWRPTMPDGSRPRIYLDADKPKDAELVDIMEAAEQLEASKRVIQKKETEAKRKGIRGIWKFGTGRKIVQSAPKRKPMLRASSAAPLFDSEGKEYRATYEVIATDTDGKGPVLASNLPETFDETPDYPSVFQARSLQRTGETQKIRKIAKDLDPDRLLLPHSDATLGAPVVWQGDGKTHKYGKSKVKTEKGDYYVLGGNGRTIALLMTSKSRYQSYVQRGKSLWPDLWPKGGSPDGKRNILVRVVSKPNGDPLTFAEARTLAGRTQKAASGEESPIGRAISLIRSLGIEDVTELPMFKWTGIITQDNVEDFVNANPAFTNAVFAAMGGARAESYKQDEALTASLFNDLMVGYLPRKFQLEGFVSEKQERTLLTALPIMMTIHSRVLAGDIQPKWDLFPLLPSALRFSQLIKAKSDKQAIEMVEAAAAQVQLGEGTAFSEKFKSLFDELPILAVMLGIVLKKGETTRDPALTVEKFLVPYAEKALSFKTSPSEAQMGFLAPRGQPDEGSDPAEVLAGLLKIKLPSKTRQLFNNPTHTRTRRGFGIDQRGRPPGQFETWVQYWEWKLRSIDRAIRGTRELIARIGPEQANMPGGANAQLNDYLKKRREIQRQLRRRLSSKKNRRETSYFESIGPKGAPVEGERGFKMPRSYGNAYGGLGPFELATRMFNNAYALLDEYELFAAWCAELPDQCEPGEWEYYNGEPLADLIDVPLIGGDGSPLSSFDRALFALTAVQTAMEASPDRAMGLEVPLGIFKSRKGPPAIKPAPRGEFGEVPRWAAIAMLTDWLESMVPGKPSLRIVNIDKQTASDFIERHHSALPYLNARGLLFALGLMKGDRLVAVATANTPSGRWDREPRVLRGELDPRNILELSRVASDGSTKGASSKLVSRIIDVLDRAKRGNQDAPSLFVTYQLSTEPGTTYKGLEQKGLRPVSYRDGGEPSGARSGGSEDGDQALARADKIRWECCVSPPAMRADWSLVREKQATLFNPSTNTYIAPMSASKAAKKALAIRERMPKSRKAGTRVGLARAHQIANQKPMSFNTVKRMKAFFDRHDGARERAARLRDPESKAAQAWGLWGGTPGRRWAEGVIASKKNPRSQALLGTAYEDLLSPKASQVLDQLRRQGSAGYAANDDGEFPRGVKEVLDAGLAVRTICAPRSETVFDRDTCTIRLTPAGREFIRTKGMQILEREQARQVALFNPKGAPGYQSYSWIQEDWRAVKVSNSGKIDYTQKCGAKGTKTASGKPRLCLPLKAIKSLMRSKAGKEQLKKQARAKSRAKKGARVSYLPLVKKAVHKATKDSPEDNPSHSQQLSLDLIQSLPVLHFASGSNHPGEIRGFADLGKAVGAAYGTTSKATRTWSRLCKDECIEELVAATNKGIPVFLDSGAFSEVDFSDGTARVVSPITPKMWADRFEVYRELADRAGALANVVAPDMVGNQSESFARLQRYADEVRDLIDRGATVLVPLQKGALSLSQAHQKARAILGTDEWVPALPFKKAATTPKELQEYLTQIKPQRVHLLGVGPRSKVSSSIAEAVKRGSPSTKVQMDSVALTAHVGRGKKPRRVTAAIDEARDRLLGERTTGYTEVLSPDYTDLVGFPSEWASKAALTRIGRKANLTPSEMRSLLSDPDYFFQRNGSNGPAFYDLMAPEIERELARHFHAVETFEAKRAGVREGLRELYGEPATIRNPAPVEVVSIAFDPKVFSVESADQWCETAGLHPISLQNDGTLIVFHFRDRGMIDNSTLRTIRVHPAAVARVGVPIAGEQ